MSNSKSEFVAVTIESRLLRKAKKRAELMFGNRGFSRYVRFAIAMELKRPMPR